MVWPLVAPALPSRAFAARALPGISVTIPNECACARSHLNAACRYADDTPLEQMRDERLKSVESRCRGRSVEENLRLFKEMQEASEEGEGCCCSCSQGTA